MGWGFCRCPTCNDLCNFSSYLHCNAHTNDVAINASFFRSVQQPHPRALYSGITRRLGDRDAQTNRNFPAQPPWKAAQATRQHLVTPGLFKIRCDMV